MIIERRLVEEGRKILTFALCSIRKAPLTIFLRFFCRPGNQLIKPNQTGARTRRSRLIAPTVAELTTNPLVPRPPSRPSSVPIMVPSPPKTPPRTQTPSQGDSAQSVDEEEEGETVREIDL